MEQDKIWDHYQNEPELRKTFLGKGRLRTIAKLIQAPVEVLTIGIGDGYLERTLVANGVVVNILDPSASAVKDLSRELNLGQRAHIGYSQNIECTSASMDVVVMSEVLEHLGDEILETSIREVHRVLKPGGRFIGTVPADENLLDSTVVCPDCSNIFHRWGHVQSFDAARLQRTLESVFELVDVERRYLPDLAALNWKGKIAALPKLLLAKIGGRGSNQNFLFICVKSASTAGH